MTSEITVRGIPAIKTMDDLARLSEMFARSGFFKDTREAAQIGVKIMAGAELGHAPFAAITGVHLIQGKPTYSAGLIAATVKRSGRYTYRVKEHTDEVCELSFSERDGGAWAEIGSSRFTMDDAKKAGLLSNPTWKNYPRNMLFSRALTNGVRWHCPDVFNSPVYTPDELGAEIDGDGEVVVLEPVKPQLEAPKAEPQELMLTDKRAAAMLGELAKLGYDRDAALELVAETVRKGVVSLTELTDAQALGVWNAARKGSAARLKEKAAAEAEKPEWERWQNEDEATKWAIKTGAFSGGGHLLALALEEVKRKGGDFKREWYEHVTTLLEGQKAKAA